MRRFKPSGLRMSFAAPKPQTYPRKRIKGEWICRSRFALGFGWTPLGKALSRIAPPPAPRF